MNATKIEEFHIEAPEGKIWVKKWTPEAASEKSPLVLLHDSLGSVALWREFPPKLAENLSRCVIAYDRLGFGRSDAREELPAKNFIEEEATKYFPAIKEQLSLQRYVLLGHSVGGGMAIHIASRDPDCEAVITISAQAFIEDLTLRGIRAAQQVFEQPGQLERLEKWHGNKARWVLHAWTDTWLSAEFANWNLQDAIGRVYCPVLAIHGANDEYGSSASPEFISRHSGGKGTMLLLKNCGHMPHREKTQEVITAVKQFLKTVA